MNIFCPLQKVKSKQIIRNMESNSQILVNVNDFVTPSDIIGEKKPSAGFHIVNVSSLLKVPASKAANYITRKEGEKIYKGELLAEKKKVLRKESEHIFATVDGFIQHINTKTGQIMIKIVKKQEYVPAGVWGKVAKIEQPGTIQIDAPVLQINGKAGRGFEREGNIKLLSNRHEVIQEHLIKEEYSGKIIVGGSLLTREAITKAVNVGVIGLIVGGINYEDIVLINETSDIGITILVMEGYGAVQINEDIYTKLHEYDNFYAFINGKEKSVCIPLEKIDQETDLQTVSKDIRVGTYVRITAEQEISNTGEIKEIIPQYLFASGLTASAVKVISKNKEIIVPQANVEILV